MADDSTYGQFLPQALVKSKKAVAQALVYGLSIIVIYLLLGLVITVAFGPGTLNEMATSAWFNVLFFILLVIFAVSFFGVLK